MKEVSHDKGLQDPESNYTEAQFDTAISENEARQAETEGSAQSDPLISSEDAQQITVITLMRIYDILGAILNHLDAEQADALLQAHSEGRLVGPLPALNL